MPEKRYSPAERRRLAVAFNREGRSIDFMVGYLQASPRDVRAWLTEAGEDWRRPRWDKHKFRKNHEPPRKFASSQEVAELLRRWPRVA